MKYLSLATLALIACGVSKPMHEMPRDGFQYEVAGETVAIIFDTSTQADRVDVQIQVNEHQFELGMSSKSDWEGSPGQGNPLSPAERKALALAAQDYSRQQNVTENSPLEQRTLYRALDYLSQATGSNPSSQ